MPTRAPSVCGHCNKAHPRGETCAAVTAMQRERKARHDQKRPSARQRGYDSTWEREAKAFLSLPQNEFCQCGAKATVVMHVKSMFGLFDAFIMKADARGKPLLAHDVFRPRPIAMDTGAPLSGTKAGGGPFNGDVFFQAVSANTLYLGGLPAGFIFTAGDYVEVRASVLKRSLHRIIEPTVSDANGFATVEIMYPLDTQNFNATCTGHLETPSCLMMIDPGSVTAPKSWGSREGSFSATEIFFS